LSSYRVLLIVLLHDEVFKQNLGSWFKCFRD